MFLSMFDFKFIFNPVLYHLETIKNKTNDKKQIWIFILRKNTQIRLFFMFT